MNNDLISKKDLLELTGISYGQLYRWKRKDLIPEEWFIRKSTFTGQETFFPRKKVLERIEKIQTMKENLSLDELADMFSPSITKLEIDRGEMVKRNIVSNVVLHLLSEEYRIKEFTFSKILQAFIVEKLLQSGDVNLEEGKMVLDLILEHEKVLNQQSCFLIITRKLGVSTCFLLVQSDGIYFEKGTKVVIQLSLPEVIEELKIKLL